MWARGLKQKSQEWKSQTLQVAPHVGAWIETQKKAGMEIANAGRAPCGRVD